MLPYEEWYTSNSCQHGQPGPSPPRQASQMPCISDAPLPVLRDSYSRFPTAPEGPTAPCTHCKQLRCTNIRVRLRLTPAAQAVQKNAELQTWPKGPQHRPCNMATLTSAGDAAQEMAQRRLAAEALQRKALSLMLGLSVRSSYGGWRRHTARMVCARGLLRRHLIALQHSTFTAWRCALCRHAHCQSAGDGCSWTAAGRLVIRLVGRI